MAKNWFAVHIKARKKQLASRHFIQQGYECYLPLGFCRTQECQEERAQIVRPFFPGYLFLRLENDQQQWTSTRSTTGAICAIHFGPHYLTVPPQIIDSLRARENEAGVIEIDEAPSFKPGDKGFLASSVKDWGIRVWATK